jgi:hypothetical protein
VGRMVRANIGCEGDPSVVTSRQTLQGLLDQQTIILDLTGNKFLNLIASGDMSCELLCKRDDDLKDGPFLLLQRVSWPDQQAYASLLTDITGDDTLTDLFEPQGPIYFRILRCRPDAWKNLRKYFGAALNQQDQPLTPLP